MSARKKKANTPVDGAAIAAMSDAEADALIASVGKAMNELQRIQARLNDGLLALKTGAESEAAEHRTAFEEAYLKLATWATAHRKRLTDDGKKKTVALPSGELSWRDRPASVKLKKGADEDEIVAWLMANRFRRFVRLKYELNRQAMLAEKEVVAEHVAGVRIQSAGEVFDVAPIGVQLAEPKS